MISCTAGAILNLISDKGHCLARHLIMCRFDENLVFHRNKQTTVSHMIKQAIFSNSAPHPLTSSPPHTHTPLLHPLPPPPLLPPPPPPSSLPLLLFTPPSSSSPPLLLFTPPPPHFTSLSPPHPPFTLHTPPSYSIPPPSASYTLPPLFPPFSYPLPPVLGMDQE
jgi:hypothetical protein